MGGGPTGQYVDKGMLYLIDGSDIKPIADSNFNGETGKMEKDGESFVFPDTPMTRPVAQVAGDLAVGAKGQAGVINLNNDSAAMDIKTDLTTYLEKTKAGNLYTVWHAMEGESDCIKPIDYYLIGGFNEDSKPFLTVCERVRGFDRSCNLQNESWDCNFIEAEMGIRAVTGWSKSKEYAWNSDEEPSTYLTAGLTGLIPMTKLVLGSVQKKWKEVENTNAPPKLSITEMVATSKNSGVIVFPHQLFWYNMLDIPILTAVTPQNSEDDSCTFYRGTEYDGHLLIVAVCKTSAGGTCLTTTRLYYLDKAADVTPNGTDFRYVDVYSEAGCPEDKKVYQGRAVAVNETQGLVIVGGDRQEKATIQMFK
jgi:hypothetical protein